MKWKLTNLKHNITHYIYGTEEDVEEFITTHKGVWYYSLC